MKDKLISFETAKLAKEKGFDVDCLNFYTNPNSKMFGLDEQNRPYHIKNIPKKIYTVGKEAALNIKNVILAPTQSLLAKWLREVHSIEISVRAIKWENTELKTGLVLDSYEYEMYPLKKPYYIYHKVPGFKTYELALEEALQEALKLIKDESTNN